MLLSTLPLLPPPPQHILATTHTSHHLPSNSPQSNNNPDNPTGQTHPHHHHHQHQRHRRDPKSPVHSPHKPSSLSLLSLSQSENLIAARKTAIATFGYSWIKPAGCAKTMLGRREEELEREEVERQIREAEEAEMRDEGGFADGFVEGEEGTGEEEAAQRDLDEEVPEAEQTNVGDDDEEDVGNDTGFTAEEGEVGEETGFSTMEQGMIGEDELMMGGDLDGDVPSAEQSRLDYDDEGDEEGGEWQHTDTEEEFDNASESVEPQSQPQLRSTRQSFMTGGAEDSEMMDLSVMSAADDFPPPPSTSSVLPTGIRARVLSGNAFTAQSSTPPDQQAGGSTADPLRSAAPTSNRRSWFSRSSPSNTGPPAGTTLTLDSSAQQQPRTRRNLFGRATGGGLFSSSTSTSTPTNEAMGATGAVTPDVFTPGSMAGAQAPQRRGPGAGGGQRRAGG